MLGIFLILLFCIFLAFIFPIRSKKKEEAKKRNPKFDSQIKKLWSIAQTSMRERKPIRAEKALLTILKFDEKNAAAYNRLGILYAKGQRFDEAIECFEIAQSLDNNASSLHNAGLIYLETGAYEKAVMAFKQALELEGDVSARYIALAKAEEKIGNRKNAIEALESAYDLDRSLSTLRQILTIYESLGDTEKIAATNARIEAQVTENNRKKEAGNRTKRTRIQKAQKIRKIQKAQARKAPKRPAAQTQRPAARQQSTQQIQAQSAIRQQKTQIQQTRLNSQQSQPNPNQPRPNFNQSQLNPSQARLKNSSTQKPKQTRIAISPKITH